MMKRKTILGMILLITISLLPLLPWYFLGPVKGLPLTYDNLTHSFGQICALVGVTMFALTFVLSTRLKPIEKLLGGLDKVYIVHRIFGSTAFILLLMHPILLVLKFIPARPDLAALYLIPGHGTSVDMGIIALSGLILLLCITFYINMKYHYWKMSHKFMGLFFVFAIIHIFLVRGEASRDYIFQGYYIFAGIVSAIGLLAFLYSLLFKSISSATYRVSSIKKQNSKIFDITLEPLSKPLKYKAGQFGFFRFHNKKMSTEFHPFSFASSTDNPNVRVIIKELGDYTSKLKHLKVGDKVSIEGPYGEFTVKDKEDNMLWLAGGIGITPFVGMAGDISSSGKAGKTSLYYCAANKHELIALDEFMAVDSSKLTVVPWCSDADGHISLKDISKTKESTKVYVCGPSGFKSSLIGQLLANGTSKENIFEEDFDLK